MRLQKALTFFKMAKEKVTGSEDQRIIQIGMKVRELRKKVCPNYEQFAFTHNINKVTLSNIETGKDFRMSSLLKVLDAIQISQADFFALIDVSQSSEDSE